MTDPPRTDPRRSFVQAIARAVDGRPRSRGGPRRPLVEPGERVLVACSGGADSTALALGLGELGERRRRGFAVVLAHVDHGLRSAAEAEADRAFVDGLGRAIGARVLHARAADLREQARAEGRGLEAAARAARYRLLAGCAAAEGSQRVAVGHTRDDQVETILLRMLRGAGLRGIAGMPARRALAAVPGAGGGQIELVRPLLGISRAAVMAYLGARGHGHRDDPTNQDPAFALRNRVRRDLVPLVLALRPGADQALLRLARAAAAGDRALRAAAERGLAEALVAAPAEPRDEPPRGDEPPTPTPPSALALRLALAPLRRLDPDVLALALSMAVERTFAMTLGARHLDALRALVEGGSGARADLPRGLGAVRERCALVIARATVDPPGPPVPPPW